AAGQVLGGLEGEGAHVPERTGAAPVVFTPVRMRGVLDDGQLVLPRDRYDRVHVAGHAADVDGDDRPRARRDRFLDLGRVDVEGLTIDVHENRGRVGFD